MLIAIECKHQWRLFTSHEVDDDIVIAEAEK
jgi:hypothetical protein